MTDTWILTRQEASRLIVFIDLAIIFVFVCAIYKLKDYQDMSIQDYKNGQLRINDFSVYMPDIPIHASEYNNNPELLKAMIAVHLEEVL